jgi:hypothetical protein
MALRGFLHQLTISTATFIPDLVYNGARKTQDRLPGGVLESSACVIAVNATLIEKFLY